MGLEVHPELRSVSEEQTEAEGRVRRDPTAIVHDLSNSIGRDPDGFGELVLRQTVLG